jgi:DNA-binding beta-propeller fold protein YncE
VTLPTGTPASLPEILPTAASIIPVKERLLASFTILKEPDEMVFVQGFIWTKTADGHVVQIDPATNNVIADIKVDTATIPHHYCQGMGTDGEDIWVCSASSEADNTIIDVVRVDPVSQSIVETFKVEKIFEQLDLPFLLNQIWVLVDGGGRLIGIDVTTNQVSSTIDLGARCFQVAAVDRVLMATCALNNLVLQIDPERGEVTAQVTLQRPGHIAGNEDGIWVAQASSIVRLDPATLNPVALFTNLPEMDSGDIFITKEAVWVRHEGGFLYQIDPTTNQFVEQIQFGQNLAGGSVLVTSDSIWATAYDDNLLVRLSLK